MLRSDPGHPESTSWVLEGSAMLKVGIYTSIRIATGKKHISYVWNEVMESTIYSKKR